MFPLSYPITTPPDDGTGLLAPHLSPPTRRLGRFRCDTPTLRPLSWRRHLRYRHSSTTGQTAENVTSRRGGNKGQEES